MKTRVKVIFDDYISQVSYGDTGYIDAYVSGGDGCPYAVFVRDGDGLIDAVSVRCLQAIGEDA